MHKKLLVKPRKALTFLKLDTAVTECHLWTLWFFQHASVREMGVAGAAEDTVTQAEQGTAASSGCSYLTKGISLFHRVRCTPEQPSCHVPAWQLSHENFRAPWDPWGYCHNFPACFMLLLLLFRVFSAKSPCFSVLCTTRSWWKPPAPRAPRSPPRTAAAVLVAACWEDALGCADDPGAQTQRDVCSLTKPKPTLLPVLLRV